MAVDVKRRIGRVVSWLDWPCLPFSLWARGPSVEGGGGGLRTPAQRAEGSRAQSSNLGHYHRPRGRRGGIFLTPTPWRYMLSTVLADLTSPRLPALGPEARSLDEVLAHPAAHAPGSLAFAADGERLSYGGLRAEAEALAGGAARHGVGPGDRVALLLPAGLGFVPAFFALQRLAPVALSR